jgi:magnesium chelatase family protein
MLLVGTPGSGKTMLAKSMPSILPELTFNEALEITKIQSITGIMEAGEGIASERPFRSPHHSASTAALVGGGQKAMPGEISLAHYGVLFLDEFPEFSKDVLESLRQPLEDGVVTITRASAKATYPADFMLIAAMNPCPCGYYGSRMQECRCKPYEIAKYRNRISGPLLDRLDMHVEMAEVGYSDITSNKPGESSAAIRERVDEARRIQRERYKKDGIICNAQLSARLVKKYCVPDENGQRLMRQAYERLNLSARAYNRVMKVARTIADLSGGGDITYEHIAEAIQYRTVDKKYWGE